MVKILIIVDTQNDFCEGGSLEVPKANQIFPYINDLRKKVHFDKVFITLDWHPADHLSFAQNHGLPPFSVKTINNEQQILWPVHCVEGTQGADLSKLLEIDGSQTYIKKGQHKYVQQYSGFGVQNYPTEFKQKLDEFQVDQAIVVGLALDFCVGNTALDAKKAGCRNVTVIKEATKGVNEQSCQQMVNKFKQSGVGYITFKQFVKQ